ncbi:hypothetical protein Nepgr_026695 [Nepenthes gracilis]|uniref:Uncharacterized protein n=1 Tax=Nepenthes gracilis TaxID=150966 RepID=A0AAD3Y0M1_NEPGR|nr:hypothetical protein Nepgr_026695 [Nepenthes gracilis]
MINGNKINVVYGLELHTGVFAIEGLKDVVERVYKLQNIGQKGQLDRDGHPLGLIRDEEVDSLPSMFKQINKRMVRWHILPPSCVPTSCLVNMLRITGPRAFSGPISISLPIGSVMILTNTGANTAKHCDPPIPQVELPMEAWGLAAPHVPYSGRRDGSGAGYEVGAQPALERQPGSKNAKLAPKNRLSTWSSGESRACFSSAF